VGTQLTKSDLVERICARYSGLSRPDGARAVSAVMMSLAQALAAGGRVELRGFGSFTVKTRPPRLGRNPRSGEPIHVKPKKAPSFRTGKELRKRMNAAAETEATALDNHLRRGLSLA
jgi:integration host factor subunit beta